MNVKGYQHLKQKLNDSQHLSGMIAHWTFWSYADWACWNWQQMCQMCARGKHILPVPPFQTFEQNFMWLSLFHQ